MKAEKRKMVVVYFVRNRFRKIETSFLCRFQCVNGLHEIGFDASMQWLISPRDIGLQL